jgi:ketosteroid isomerase-like protein
MPLCTLGEYRLQSFTLTDQKVHVYGHTAVVTGLFTQTATFKDKDIGGAARHTIVFVKRDDRWQVVASQFTDVPVT